MERIICLIMGNVFGLFQTAFFYGKAKGQNLLRDFPFGAEVLGQCEPNYPCDPGQTAQSAEAQGSAVRKLLSRPLLAAAVGICVSEGSQEKIF